VTPHDRRQHPCRYRMKKRGITLHVPSFAAPLPTFGTTRAPLPTGPVARGNRACLSILMSGNLGSQPPGVNRTGISFTPSIKFEARRR